VHNNLGGRHPHATSASLVWGNEAKDRAPKWPADTLSYSFDLDDDLAKLVTIQAVPGGLEVDVQYGRDHLMRHDRYTMPLDRPPRITCGKIGVTVEAVRPLLPGLGWPRWRLTYRF